MPRSVIEVTAGAGTNVDTHNIGSATAPRHRERVNRAEPFESVWRSISPRQTHGTASRTALGVLHNTHATRRIGVTTATADWYSIASGTTMVVPPIISISRSGPPTSLFGGTVYTPVIERGNASVTAGDIYWIATGEGATGSMNMDNVEEYNSKSLSKYMMGRQLNSTTAGLGYEISDRVEFIANSFIELAPGEFFIMSVAWPNSTLQTASRHHIITSIRWGVFS